MDLHAILPRDITGPVQEYVCEGFSRKTGCLHDEFDILFTDLFYDLCFDGFIITLIMQYDCYFNL